MLVTFDKVGIKRQIEFGQPYQHKRFFERRSGEKNVLRPILGGVSWVAKNSCRGQILINECSVSDYPFNFEGL